MVSQKLVFAREAAGPTRRYKLLSLPEPKPGKPSSTTLSELQRLAGEDFQVREIFYTYGLHVILEQQTEARATEAQPSALSKAGTGGGRQMNLFRRGVLTDGFAWKTSIKKLSVPAQILREK